MAPAATANSLAYNGTGLLLLSASNRYSGTTTVSSGVVQITNSAALGTSTISLPKGGLATGTLQLNLTGTNVLANPFAGFWLLERICRRRPSEYRKRGRQQYVDQQYDNQWHGRKRH